VIFLILVLTMAPLMAAYELCDNRIAESELEIIDVIDVNQTNETTWTWEQTSNINIEVNVKNNNLNLSDFEVELLLLDEDNQPTNFTSTNTNPTQTVTLNESEEDTLNFSFKLKELTHPQYTLYVKLTDENNESICTSLRATSTTKETTIEMAQEEKIVMVRNVEGPANTTPGSKVEYIVEIINLGDATEGQVVVIAYNRNLNLREEKIITALEVEKSKNVTFNFTIPDDAIPAQESFWFSTEYDYDEKKERYYQSSDKVKTFYTQIIQGQATQVQNQTTQTENQTTQGGNQGGNQTTQGEESTPSDESIPYLWPIIVTFFMAALIIIGVIFFLKHKENKYIERPSSVPTPASTYVEKIQKETKAPAAKPKPTPPKDKPSETNTENTSTPQTYKMPPRKPDSQ